MFGADGSGVSSLLERLKQGYDKDSGGVAMKIYSIVYSAMAQMIEQAEIRGLKVASANRDSNNAFNAINYSTDRFGSLDMDSVMAAHMVALWNDPAIVAVFEEKQSYSRDSYSWSHFMEQLRFMGRDRDYSPTPEDTSRVHDYMLKLRDGADGLVEFCIKNVVFEVEVIRDIVHQVRRNKILTMLNDNAVGAIIFVSSLTSYKEVDEIDGEEVNGMDRDLEFFEEIIDCFEFEDIPVMLILSNRDQLKEQLYKHPFSDYFPDYQGDNTAPEVIQFIETKFFSDHEDFEEKNFYVVPIDTPSNMPLRDVEHLLLFVKEALFQIMLKKSGLK